MLAHLEIKSRNYFTSAGSSETIYFSIMIPQCYQNTNILKKHLLPRTKTRQCQSSNQNHLAHNSNSSNVNRSQYIYKYVKDFLSPICYKSIKKSYFCLGAKTSRTQSPSWPPIPTFPMFPHLLTWIDPVVGPIIIYNGNQMEINILIMKRVFLVIIFCVS